MINIFGTGILATEQSQPHKSRRITVPGRVSTSTQALAEAKLIPRVKSFSPGNKYGRKNGKPANRAAKNQNTDITYKVTSHTKRIHGTN